MKILKLNSALKIHIIKTLKHTLINITLTTTPRLQNTLKIPIRRKRPVKIFNVTIIFQTRNEGGLYQIIIIICSTSFTQQVPVDHSEKRVFLQVMGADHFARGVGGGGVGSEGFQTTQPFRRISRQ